MSFMNYTVTFWLMILIFGIAWERLCEIIANTYEKGVTDLVDIDRDLSDYEGLITSWRQIFQNEVNCIQNDTSIPYAQKLKDIDALANTYKDLNEKLVNVSSRS